MTTNMKESKCFFDEVVTQLTNMRHEVIELKDRSSVGKRVSDIDNRKFTRQLESQ